SRPLRIRRCSTRSAPPSSCPSAPPRPRARRQSTRRWSRTPRPSSASPPPARRRACCQSTAPRCPSWWLRATTTPRATCTCPVVAIRSTIRRPRPRTRALTTPRATSGRTTSTSASSLPLPTPWTLVWCRRTTWSFPSRAGAAALATPTLCAFCVP
ncbi:hypothetical protein IWW51_000826, partial [Coemansia sp. RSA 2702]